jgi:hypothetical protein
MMNTTKTTAVDVDALAVATSDAYSRDTYTDGGWLEACRLLAKRGYNALEIEAILRSKFTRWDADFSNKPYGRNTGADLLRWLDAHPRERADVSNLVRETFGVSGPASAVSEAKPNRYGILSIPGNDENGDDTAWFVYDVVSRKPVKEFTHYELARRAMRTLNNASK